ncbi:hypothetical protein VPH35_104818 [Triticum aestivum]
MGCRIQGGFGGQEATDLAENRPSLLPANLLHRMPRVLPRQAPDPSAIHAPGMSSARDYWEKLHGGRLAPGRNWVHYGPGADRCFGVFLIKCKCSPLLFAHQVQFTCSCRKKVVECGLMQHCIFSVSLIIQFGQRASLHEVRWHIHAVQRVCVYGSRRVCCRWLL